MLWFYCVATDLSIGVARLIKFWKRSRRIHQLCRVAKQFKEGFMKKRLNGVFYV